MRDYIDVVVCRHDGGEKPFVFRAPAWSHLNEGDKVIVETYKGESMATVLKCASVAKDSEELDVIVSASGASLPLKKVLQKVKFIDFQYDDEEESADEHESDGNETEA